MLSRLLRGTVSLVDESRGVLIRGDLEFGTDGEGHSVVCVANDANGTRECLVFTERVYAQNLAMIINAMDATYTDVDIASGE